MSAFDCVGCITTNSEPSDSMHEVCNGIKCDDSFEVTQKKFFPMRKSNRITFHKWAYNRQFRYKTQKKLIISVNEKIIRTI